MDMHLDFFLLSHQNTLNVIIRDREILVQDRKRHKLDDKINYGTVLLASYQSEIFQVSFTIKLLLAFSAQHFRI